MIMHKGTLLFLAALAVFVCAFFQLSLFSLELGVNEVYMNSDTQFKNILFPLLSLAFLRELNIRNVLIVFISSFLIASMDIVTLYFVLGFVLVNSKKSIAMSLLFLAQICVALLVGIEKDILIILSLMSFVWTVFWGEREFKYLTLLIYVYLFSLLGASDVFNAVFVVITSILFIYYSPSLRSIYIENQKVVCKLLSVFYIYFMLINSFELYSPLLLFLLVFNFRIDESEKKFTLHSPMFFMLSLSVLVTLKQIDSIFLVSFAAIFIVFVFGLIKMALSEKVDDYSLYGLFVLVSLICVEASYKGMLN